jgi:hypothetical protein
MKMASVMMCTSVILLSAGMIAGIVMGIEHSFILAPAHAHLNLVGGVLLFLFGLYYTVVPKAAEMSLAKVQAWLHIVGAIIFPIGIALTIGVSTSLEPVAIIGSFVVLVAILLFAAIVIKVSKA